MDWTQAIDAYCERTGPGFWAEPFNAVSNLAFLIAAAIGLALLRRSGRSDPLGLALTALVAVSAVGSFLFHTFANRWSELADTIPIAIFIYVYFGLALSRFFGLGAVRSLAGTAAFLAGAFLAGPVLAIPFGSSAGYVPALAAMLAIGGLLTARSDVAGPLVLGAGLVFAASLGFRMADEPLCPVWPLGTHFLWHVLNAATLALLLAAALRPQGRHEKGRKLPPKPPAMAVPRR